MVRLDTITGTSPNRAYLASMLRTPSQIPLRGISDMLGTLSKMLYRGGGNDGYVS
ncbi:MAG: hypothetical protein GYA60_01655 [Candidatus Methanofastidiosa archaeon]|nr:hypothetical protein [Candidatus Methanofastidiosa archaeon]